MGRNRSTVEALAAERGLVYVGSVRDSSRQVSGVHLSWQPKEVVEFDGEPYVQMANHGWRYGLGGSDLKPSRRGFIAVRHAMQDPRFYVSSSVLGALSLVNVASNVVNVVSSFGVGGEGDSTSNFGSFMKRCSPLDVPEGLSFKVMCLKDQLVEGQALMTPESLEILNWLARSYDVEMRDGWLVAYNAFGDTSTEDPQVWDWVLSVASRLGDLLALWGDPRDFRGSWPWYVEERRERPRQLDGSLRFLKRKR